MGTRITKVTPFEGVAAETAGAITLFVTEALKIPVSTTHTITGSIIGVGATKRLSAVRWGVTVNLLWAWILTIPVSGALAALVYVHCTFNYIDLLLFSFLIGLYSTPLRARKKGLLLMSTILVTGGSGYIGSHTIVDLIENGYNVISVDNNCRSNPAMLEGVEKITGKKVKNYKVDLCNFDDTFAIFQENEDIEASFILLPLKQ